MPTQVRRRIARILGDKRRRDEYLAALAMLAVVVVVAVAAVLTQQGHAATQEVQVLDCPVTGTVAHAHDESCYDGDGNLVCPLPEVEAHVHDDSCYAEERVLVCGLEEGEGHVHTDGCYEVVRTLVCGKDEVTETHVHGPGCFRTVDVEVPDEGPAGDGTAQSPGHEATPAAGEDLSETHPKQSFSHEFKDADGNLVLRVEVEAPEGALPAGSRMVATWVDPESLSQKQQDAVDGAIAEKADGQVLGMQAVDIEFLDADGAEVEPARKVTVTMTSGLVDTEDQALVVHIDDLTDAQEKAQEQALREGKSADEAEPDRTAEAVESLSDEALAQRDVAAGDDRLSFESDRFSTYVLAVTSLHKVMEASDGSTVTVTVDAPAEAGIPQGAELRVQEVARGSADWQGYEERALGAIGADEAELARFFDIAIVGEDGAEIQPAEPVSVEIALADAPVAGDASVVHFGEETEVVPATEDAGVATFDASGFSVYGVVYTVDFHWNVDGQDFEYNLQGGDAIGLRDLVQALGVVKDADEAGAFVKHATKVEFSTPELLAVSKVDEDTTVGKLKAKLHLEPEYSDEVTEEDVAKMDARQLVAPDWALVSLKPFDTDETLTVTMTNGEVVVIKVTDDQENPFGLDGKSFAITASKNGTYYYLNNEISSGNGNCLRAYNYNPSSNGTPQGTTWTFEWTGEGKKYLIHDGQNHYILIENNKVSLTDRDTALANPITVASRDGKYSFINEKNNQALNIYGSEGFGRWGYSETNSDFLMTLQDPSNLKQPGTITTADTNGILQINLFDYGPEDELDKEANNNSSPYSGGINSGHTLKFFSYGKNTGTGVNDFTGAGNGPQTGIVADQLVGNYPVVASNPSESLDYLFGGVTNTNVDPHPGLNHLFTKDENGYYHYNSDQNYAYLDGTDFKVYSKTFPEEGADQQYFGVGFFPFNDYNEYYNCIHGKDGFYWDPHRFGTDKSGHYDHHFGMSLIGNFIMPPDGQYNGKDVTFQFSGDDDLWVFVDGVLIMDIGGVHNPVSGEINFTTGEVTVHGAAQENFKEKYKRLTGNDWDDSDFSNHDFRVFYMERGGMYSNLEVTFNLPLTPKTETNDFQFDKVSSENESLKLSGAEFSLFTDPSCNDPLTLASVPVKATSSDDGTVSFRHVPHGTYYMKETAYPQGYQAKNPEEVFTVEVGATGATITLSGEPVTKVTNQPKKIDVDVEKIWTGGIVPQGASIEIVLGRYELVESPDAPGKGKIVIKDSYTGLPESSSYQVTYTITGPNDYSKTISRTFTEPERSIEETVKNVPAGKQYTVTKQVQAIPSYNTSNASGTQTVTVPKNGSVDAQFDQSTFAEGPYRVRIYAVKGQNWSNLYKYSEANYPAGSALSVNIQNNKSSTWSEGFRFTCYYNSSSGASHQFTSNGSWQFTNSLSENVDIYVYCNSHSGWTNDWNQIRTPTISGANPVRAASTSRAKAPANTVALGQTAEPPTPPTPPADTIYQVDETYAENPDTITLSNGVWTGKVEGLDAYNEYGPYLYYIAEVNETGMPAGTTIEISDELTSDGSAQVLTVTNTVPTGYLKVNKSVTHNGVTPTTQQAAALAGTYTFYVYTDAQCSASHRVDDLVLTVTIGADGAASSSTPVKLPAGDYWIEEQTPSQTGVTPEENRIHVKVTADNTTSAAAHADFVNNKYESNDPDELAIELEKKFTGLSGATEIPAGFQTTLTYNVPGGSTNPVTVALTGSSQGDVTCIKSADGMTWHWKVTHIPSNATGFGISESNYDVAGYTRITKINGSVVSDPSNPTGVTVLVPTVTFENFTSRDYTTPDSNKNFTVLDGTNGNPLQILLVRMTNHATVIVSQKTLGIATRTAIENALSANGWKIPGDEGAQAQWDDTVVYFSHEEQGNKFSYGGRTIYFEGNTVKIPHNASSHEARVDVVYKTESAENSFVLENAYSDVPIGFDILKVEAGKEDSTQLQGAVFELRQLKDEAPTNNGTLSYVTGDDDEPIVTSKTTGSNGRLTFDGLKRGYYEVTEAKAPDGYVMPADLVFYVKVEGGVVTRLSKGAGKPSTWTDASDDEMIHFTTAQAAVEDNLDTPESEAVEAQNALFRVSNEPGQPLPNAGGPGTRMFMLVGTSLMIGALLMLVRRRRMA